MKWLVLRLRWWCGLKVVLGSSAVKFRLKVVESGASSSAGKGG